MITAASSLSALVTTFALMPTAHEPEAFDQETQNPPISYDFCRAISTQSDWASDIALKFNIRTDNTGFSAPLERTYIDWYSDKSLCTLAKFSQLPADWCGPGSNPPTHKAIADAANFLKMLNNSLLPEPIIAPSNDGEINFFWEKQGGIVDLGLYGNGTYSYYARTTTGEEFFGDDVPVSKMLDREVVKKILFS